MAKIKDKKKIAKRITELEKEIINEKVLDEIEKDWRTRDYIKLINLIVNNYINNKNSKFYKDFFLFKKTLKDNLKVFEFKIKDKIEKWETVDDSLLKEQIEYKVIDEKKFFK